jgi:DNA-binding response OmpR family regulator
MFENIHAILGECSSVVFKRGKDPTLQDESQRSEGTVGSENTPITVGPITVDVSHLQVSIDGKRLSLTGAEGHILHFLAIHANTICTFSQIGSEVLGYDNDGAIGFIRIAIHHIRQKIEPDPMHPIYLHTIPEVGYMLESHDQDGAKQTSKGVRVPNVTE